MKPPTIPFGNDRSTQARFAVTHARVRWSSGSFFPRLVLCVFGPRTWAIRFLAWLELYRPRQHSATYFTRRHVNRLQHLHLAGKRLQQRSQGPQQQQSTPSSNVSSRGKKTPNAYNAIRDECMPLTGFFRGCCRLLLRPLRGSTRKYRHVGRLETNNVRLEF